MSSGSDRQTDRQTRQTGSWSIAVNPSHSPAPTHNLSLPQNMQIGILKINEPGHCWDTMGYSPIWFTDDQLLPNPLSHNPGTTLPAKAWPCHVTSSPPLTPWTHFLDTGHFLDTRAKYEFITWVHNKGPYWSHHHVWWSTYSTCNHDSSLPYTSDYITRSGQGWICANSMEFIDNTN